MAASLREMIRAIGGDNQAAAAKILGLSRTTVSAAYNGGHVSQATARKIRAGYAVAARREAKEGAGISAGTWAVGLPETRSADPEIRAECVVSHLREPAFSLHVQLRYGQEAGDPEMTLTRVTGSKRGVGSLLEVAREKALAFMSRQSVGEQDARMVDHLERRYAGKGFSMKEARTARWEDLITAVDELSRDEIKAAEKVADRLAADARGQRQELGEMSERDNAAFEAGRSAGLLEMRAQVLRELLSEARRLRIQPVGTLLLKRELAHKDTVRGGRRTDQQVNAQIAQFREEVRSELQEEGVAVGEDLMPEGVEWLESMAVTAAISEAEGAVAIASGSRAKREMDEAKEAVKTTIRSVAGASSFRGDEHKGGVNA